MTAQARRVVREALEFSPAERADVAAELLASLDEPLEESEEDIEKAWAVEIERRARRVLAGEPAGAAWDTRGKNTPCRPPLATSDGRRRFLSSILSS